jgi:hypothetical protein
MALINRFIKVAHVEATPLRSFPVEGRPEYMRTAEIAITAAM